MDAPQASTSSPSAIERTLIPTTDEIAEECPRSRILIVGRSGVGKSSLIKAIFKVDLADGRHFGAGSANISEGITSPHNKHLIIHDSECYEPGDEQKFRVLEEFIAERSLKESIAERLHAIWLCIAAPCVGDPIFQTWDERIFSSNQRKVPIIVVYTKFDIFIQNNLPEGKDSTMRPNCSLASAERRFNEKYDELFRESTRNIGGEIPYTVVTDSMQLTLQRLVELTMKNIKAESPSISSGPALGPFEDVLDPTQITFATAQRIDTSGKIDASIKVGKKKYWRAIASGIHFLNFSLKKCLDVIHKDLVSIWNIRDMDEFLLGDAFSRQMLVFAGDLIHQDQGNDSALQGKATMAAAAGRPTSNLWASGIFKRWPEHVRCMMGYVVDLTLILQAVFLVSLQDYSKGKVTPDLINEVIYEFHLSDKKKRIHDAIRDFPKPSLSKGDVVDKIESLIKENEMTKNDTKFDQNRSTLPSLLRILKFEQSANGLIVNQMILDLTCKLFNSPDYDTIVAEMRDPFDGELLIDFNLLLLQTNSLLDSGNEDGNRKARTLMLNLLKKANVIPKSLFIADIKIDIEQGMINIGGFGRVFLGKYKGELVALKLLGKGLKDGKFSQELVLEVLARRSLSHPFVLPLLGIFIDRSLPYFVSPHMKISLTEWRKTHTPTVPEINRLVRLQRLPREFDGSIIDQVQEVAAGVRYFHEEGIVHGDLRGENVLLDAEHHCRIAADVGLSQQDNAIVTLSAEAVLFNFAAPELFVNLENREARVGSKTTQTDVYAFGCLYYSIFFNTVPFEGENEYQIMQLVSAGKRPDRLQNPKIAEGPWNLILKCWKAHPSERPSMERIVMILLKFTPLLSLLAILKESTPFGGAMVNKGTLRLMCELFEPCEAKITGPGLKKSEDVELILDSLLHLLRNRSLTNLGIRDANRKARRLMFKIISETHVVPKSLFINNVRTLTHLGTIGAGGFGRVFRGEHEGRQVAVKVVDKGHKDNTLIKAIRREALTWRSLSHRFILPLLGIYEEKLQLSLVSPLMENGTLAKWREQCTPDIAKVHRAMLEVAEGVQHLHSEGVVHGDLHGGNVLLDSEFHCKITDFGLTRHAEAAFSRSTKTFLANFAAPELFGLCIKCSNPDCGGYHEGHGEHHIGKTTETDVYAFGCLYYAIFFNTVPFLDKSDLQILGLVTKGARPERLNGPRIDDKTWNLITSCWIGNPSERPTMDAIVKTMKL